MLVIPAIDIRNGNCVRLLQGDPGRETVYSSSPVDMALRFESLGARLLHVVDLDGAFQGRPVNREIVSSIKNSIAIPIEIGGGIRTQDDLKMYMAAGITRIIIGTKALDGSFSQILGSYRDAVILGIDARNSLVATHGWKNISSVKAVDCIATLYDKGFKEFIYTDIATDGMLSGPNFSGIEEILKKVPGIKLIASGGISSLEDVRRLAQYGSAGLTGCIIGKAIYDGRIDAAKALSIS